MTLVRIRVEVLLLGLFLRPFYLNISNSFSLFCRCEIKIGSSFYFTVFFWFCKWILLFFWTELVLKTPYWVLLSTKFIIRFFRRLCYCGKQQEPLNLVTQLASTCRTEQCCRLEALLACIRGRLGFKNISLPVWRQETDCNNNKGREIYFRRIHQFTMGYVNNEIRNKSSAVSTNLYMRLKKYEMDKNSWNKLAWASGLPKGLEERRF